MELFDMPTEDALKKRWEKGLADVRGDSVGWVGLPPLHEAYEEVLDIINYVREASNQGHLNSCEAYYIERETRNLAANIRMCILGQPW